MFTIVAAVWLLTWRNRQLFNFRVVSLRRLMLTESLTWMMFAHYSGIEQAYILHKESIISSILIIYKYKLMRAEKDSCVNWLSGMLICGSLALNTGSATLCHVEVIYFIWEHSTVNAALCSSIIHSINIHTPLFVLWRVFESWVIKGRGSELCR